MFTKNATSKPFGAMRVDRDGFAARLRPDPMENVIIGADRIMRYIGVRSYATLWRYIEQYGFPAIKRPDGLWMTTMTSVDQWIFLVAETVNDKLERSRGLNAKADIALERLRRQVDDGTISRKAVNAALKTAEATGLAPEGAKLPRRRIGRDGYEGRERSEPKHREVSEAVEHSEAADE